MARNEKETREQIIDPKLVQAGWDVLKIRNVIEKDKACIETPVKGMTNISRQFNGKRICGLYFVWGRWKAISSYRG